MTCIKTGARVYFRNYGFIAPADLYKVRDNIIIRWTTAGVQYVPNDADATFVVEYVNTSEDWWFRDDLGVCVVPEDYCNAYEG
jgi:hypothetical protein